MIDTVSATGLVSNTFYVFLCFPLRVGLCLCRNTGVTWMYVLHAFLLNEKLYIHNNYECIIKYNCYVLLSVKYIHYFFSH